MRSIGFALLLAGAADGRAGPVEDMMKAVQAAKDAVESAKRAIVPPKPGAPVPAPLPSPVPTGTQPPSPPPSQTQAPNSAAVPATAGSPTAAVPQADPSQSFAAPQAAASPQVVSPTVAPSDASNWVHRVVADYDNRFQIGWTTDESIEFQGYLQHFNPCSSFRVGGNGVNELVEQDQLGKIRLEQHYPQMLGQFAVVDAMVKKAPASAPLESSPAPIRCLAILKQQFPELGRLQFEYSTFKGGQLVARRGGLKELLVDGAFDAAGKTIFVPAFAPEDVEALGDLTPPAVPVRRPGAALVARATGKPPGRAGPPSRALQSTFSIGGYEAVAIRPDGSIEVREFDSSDGRFAARIGSGRILPGTPDVVGVKAQAVFDSIRIGTVALFRDGSGNWGGWRAKGPPVKVSFASHLSALNMLKDLEPPPDDRIVNVAGGRSALWMLYDDGTVLMSSERGALPGTFVTNWQKEHKFKGVVKVVSTAGPNGSSRALFLREDGTVWMNGPKFFQGWLQAEGNATERKNAQLADPAYSPVRIDALSHVRDLAAYLPSTAPGMVVALLDDGSVVWFSLSPDVSAEGLGRLAVIPVRRFGKAKAIAAGAWGVGAVDTKGSVWVWGTNPEAFAQEGRAPTGFRGGAAAAGSVDEPVMIPGIGDVVAIDFSYTFAGAMRSDGSVWIWNAEPPVKIFDSIPLPR